MTKECLDFIRKQVGTSADPAPLPIGQTTQSFLHGAVIELAVALDTVGCGINYTVCGDHAYCECHCHKGTLPAVPPSRERRPANTEFALMDTGLDQVYKALEK